MKRSHLIATTLVSIAIGILIGATTPPARAADGVAVMERYPPGTTSAAEVRAMLTQHTRFPTGREARPKPWTGMAMHRVVATDRFVHAAASREAADDALALR